MTTRLTLLLALGVALLQPALPAAEPRNVNLAKEDALRYISTGEYGRDLAKVAARAGQHVARRTARPPKEGEKLAIVFDIDETTLTNLSHITGQDFGYVPAVWDAWVAGGQARAIVPVQLVYDIAVQQQVAVFFITGRTESGRAATERNLRQTGYTTWTRIHFKPDGSKESARAFKTALRKQITGEGYTIIANIGDQQSDLEGGYAERTFKLPNPFYLVR